MAAGDLTSLAKVKRWLPASSVAATADDVLLTDLISQVSAVVQNEINRTIASASYTETHDGQGGAMLMLNQWPVTAVASVTIDGVAVPVGSPVTSGFYFDGDGVYLTGYAFSKGHANVVVAYTAGYASTPADIERAVISAVARTYRERDRIGVTSHTQGQQVTAFFTGAWSPAELAVLDNYRAVARAA